MLDKAQVQTVLPEFELYKGQHYKDVELIQLALEDIVEAAGSGKYSSLCKLDKDKSGEITLFDRSPERIVPLLTMTKGGLFKVSHIGADFHKQFELVNKVCDLRDEVKLPVMDTTGTIFPPKPA